MKGMFVCVRRKIVFVIINKHVSVFRQTKSNYLTTDLLHLGLKQNPQVLLGTPN